MKNCGLKVNSPNVIHKLNPKYIPVKCLTPILYRPSVFLNTPKKLFSSSPTSKFCYPFSNFDKNFDVKEHRAGENVSLSIKRNTFNPDSPEFSFASSSSNASFLTPTIQATSPIVKYRISPKGNFLAFKTPGDKKGQVHLNSSLMKAIPTPGIIVDTTSCSDTMGTSPSSRHRLNDNNQNDDSQPLEKFLLSRGHMKRVILKCKRRNRNDEKSSLFKFSNGLRKNIQKYVKKRIKCCQCHNSTSSQIELGALLRSESNGLLCSRHPAIIKFYGIKLIYNHEDLKPASFCVYMEYGGGNTLHNLLNGPCDTRGKILEESEKLAILKQVCQALEFCHSRDILHLDVKPANVYVDEKTKTAKLGDFGSSIRSADIDENHHVEANLTRGTWQYMAPEILQGKIPTPHADMYSLGVTVWQTLHEKMPYDGELMDQVIYEVVKFGKRPPFSHRFTDAAFKYKIINFNKIVEQCWNNDPYMRPTTNQFLQKLNIFLFNPLPIFNFEHSR